MYMSRKVSVLLMKLSQTDVDSNEFLTISKQIAEAFKEHTKNKLEKEANPKPKKEKVKVPKVVLCEDCVVLLNDKLKPIIPEKV